jgi:predicted secreted protein
MSNHTGNEGALKVGGNTIAEFRSWSLDINAGTVDTTTIGSTWDSHAVTQKNWSGSAEVFWDETDPAQVAADAGDSVALVFYPEGTDSGDTYFSGTATVEKLTIKGTFNGMVEASLSFKGNGALGKSTV